MCLGEGLLTLIDPIKRMYSSTIRVLGQSGRRRRKLKLTNAHHQDDVVLRLLIFKLPRLLVHVGQRGEGLG
jgi:hypothetical protein